MRKRFVEGVKRFIRDESGQGITEYAAILAFVAIFVAVLFGVASSPLSHSISAAFSAIVSQINNLSTDAAGASGS